MGKSGAPKPAKKATPKATPQPVATLKPQGSTTKRTPTSAFDGAAGRDIYEPEKIIAQRLAKERVFSAAGKMHDDLKKSAKDTTLEHSLFAAFNTD